MIVNTFENKLSNEINVSQEALAQLIEISGNEGDTQGVRVFVSGGGCNGMEYGMTLVETPTEFDFVYEAEGLNIYVDSVALGFLTGVEIDYKTEGLNKSFVFRNVFCGNRRVGDLWDLWCSWRWVRLIIHRLFYW
jgi:Iron-sulfur cluster assembly accessory protein